MQIIAGSARSLFLEVPEGAAVRPTAGRARKALFDSLGPLIPGSCVLDLFAGSGALGLEAASRGAAYVTFVEQNSTHTRILERNIARVEGTGVPTKFTVVNAPVTQVAAYCHMKPAPDIILADPPYDISLEQFQNLLELPQFQKCAIGSLLVWEIPDTPGSIGGFMNRPGFTEWKIRRFGSTDFLMARFAAS